MIFRVSFQSRPLFTFYRSACFFFCACPPSKTRRCYHRFALLPAAALPSFRQSLRRFVRRRPCLAPCLASKSRSVSSATEHLHRLLPQGEKGRSSKAGGVGGRGHPHSCELELSLIYGMEISSFFFLFFLDKGTIFTHSSFLSFSLSLSLSLFLSLSLSLSLSLFRFHHARSQAWAQGGEIQREACRSKEEESETVAIHSLEILLSSLSGNSSHVFIGTNP